MKIEGSRLWWIETLTQTLFAACQLRLRFAVRGSQLPVADLDRNHQNTRLDFQEGACFSEKGRVPMKGDILEEHERHDILI